MTKEELKKVLLVLAKHEPAYVQELLSEIHEELKKARKRWLVEIVNEDFEEYGDIFKALSWSTLAKFRLEASLYDSTFDL